MRAVSGFPDCHLPLHHHHHHHLLLLLRSEILYLGRLSKSLAGRKQSPGWKEGRSKQARSGASSIIRSLSRCTSLDHDLPHAADDAPAQGFEPRRVVRLDDGGGGEHGVVGGDVRGVLGGLLDRLHLLLAAGVVEGADDDGLAEEDVAGGREFRLGVGLEECGRSECGGVGREGEVFTFTVR